jgi:hypothetical protein
LLLIELPMALSVPINNSLMLFDSIAMNASDIFFVLIIPLLHFYNGKIGPHSRQLKYLFTFLSRTSMVNSLNYERAMINYLQ